MQVTQNQDGQVVYRLESILDIALLPDHMVDHALEGLPMLIRYTRLLLVAAEANGTRPQVVVALPSYVEFVDDGRMAVYHRAGDETIATAELRRDYRGSLWTDGVE